MMKKILIWVVLVLFILGIWFFVRFWTPEDSWICVENEWVRHGNPSSEMPIEKCVGDGVQKNKEIIYSVYFSNNKLDPEVSCIKVFPVSKIGTGEAASLKEVLEILVRGVSDKDKEDGYYTSIPENVKINSINKVGSVVTVDFSKDIEKNSGGSCRVGAIRAQIYWTIINFDKSVRSVVISVDGETETALQP